MAQFRRQLHISGLNTFNKCGEQFRFLYIEHMRRPPSGYLISGKAVDEAVGFNLNNKILTGSLAKKSDVLDVARDSVDKSPDSLIVEAVDEEETGKSREQIVSMAKDKAVRLTDCHHDLVAPVIQPFRTARKFSVNLDKFLRERARVLHGNSELAETSWERRTNRRAGEALNSASRSGWDFVGEMDIVNGYAVENEPLKLDTSKPFGIRDTKTSKRSKNQDDIDSDDQLTGYSVASMVIDGRIPDEVRLDVMVDLKSGIKPQLLKSFRKPPDVDVFLNRVAQAVSSIQQGIFTPTQQSNWWCSEKWCAFTKNCSYFKQPRSVYLNTGLEGMANDELPKPKLVTIKPTG